MTMDSFQSQTRKKRLTPNQVMLLETSFNFNNKLDPYRKSQLASQLGVPPRQVVIWYQNKRAREKYQSLETDHKMLQVRLENTVSHNAMLHEEVARLKDELRFLGSSSCDEVRSTNFIHSSKNHLDKEPYASLIGDAGIGPCGPSESMGCVALRVEETASGWFHRAAMTSHSLQWKDNGPVLPNPSKSDGLVLIGHSLFGEN
ncbi:homeobox-leucine zipper protein ATHB-52-like [Abeliophyllum distichum]|uniref:Homeobox-leucine zipper protein n=1 Tax=Abeliophyllum distichum TaxID=126358 RepID=A0ABD1QK36_9LAMI